MMASLLITEPDSK